MAENPGDFIFRGLIQRGYSPVHAAALAGHAIQESGGNPNALNEGEGAHGLLQWRLDRWDNLQKFAKERDVSPSDPNLQLDFVAKEMAGPEAKAGAKFTSATDLPSASAALKSYIRFGDDSAGTRLANAQGFLGQQAGMLSPQQGPPVQPAPVAAAGPAQGAPVAAPADDGGQTQASLQGIAKLLAQQQNAQPAPLELAQIQPVMTPAMMRARQMAQAMLSRNPTGT